MVGLLPDGARARPVPSNESRPGLGVARSAEEMQRLVLIGLLCLTLGATVFSVIHSELVSIALFGVPLLLGGLLLTLRRYFVLLMAQAACISVVVALTGISRLRLSVVGVLAISALMMTITGWRNQLGPIGGESMLIDLRDRLRSQSEMPALPPGWSVEAMMRSAGGAQFAGDFVVAAKTQRGTALEVVVVDVSGKGLAAGTRALQLSGALGGLLGALPAGQFMPAANDYLLRQEWSEGFATAAHLSLSLVTGDFELRTAGHPPGVQLNAGSGRWQVHGSSGPALGLVEDAEFSPTAGRIQPGDVLMLFTDGMVETPERDYTLGIDKLLGEAERLRREGFGDGARRLFERLDTAADDRALVLLHRR